MTDDDHSMQSPCPASCTSASSDEEIRGRERHRGKRCKISADVTKRAANAILRDISFSPSPATREPSRKRSQSPSKARNALERCKPPVILKSAGYHPQHRNTNARVKEFVQRLSDESGIFTAAERHYLEDEAQDWTQALRIPTEMIRDAHDERYPPLDWQSLHAIHAACELATNEMQHEDMWTNAVVMPLLKEASQHSALEPRLVTSIAVCSDYLPTLRGTNVDRKVDVELGFEQSKYRLLGSYLLNLEDRYPRLHQMESGFPEDIFIATVVEVKRFGSSGEGEAVVQMMVWASSMLKFLKTVLEEQWKNSRGRHEIPTLEELPLLALSTFVGGHWEYYVAYWEQEHGFLQERYVEVVQRPFPVLSRPCSSLYNIARSVRQGQRFCAWAEKDYIRELLHIFGVDWAAFQRQDKRESVIYPNE